MKIEFNKEVTLADGTTKVKSINLIEEPTMKHAKIVQGKLSEKSNFIDRICANLTTLSTDNLTDDDVECLPIAEVMEFFEKNPKSFL